MSYADDYLRQHEQQPEPGAPEFVEEKSEFFELRGWEIALAIAVVFALGVAAAVYAPRAYDWLLDVRWAVAHRADVERYTVGTKYGDSKHFDNWCREEGPNKWIVLSYNLVPPAVPEGWIGSNVHSITCNDVLRMFRESAGRTDSVLKGVRDTAP